MTRFPEGENSMVVFTEAEFELFWGDDPDEEFLDLNSVDQDYDDNWEFEENE